MEELSETEIRTIVNNLTRLINSNEAVDNWGATYSAMNKLLLKLRSFPRSGRGTGVDLPK